MTEPKIEEWMRVAAGRSAYKIYRTICEPGWMRKSQPELRKEWAEITQDLIAQAYAERPSPEMFCQKHGLAGCVVCVAAIAPCAECFIQNGICDKHRVVSQSGPSSAEENTP